MTISDVKKSTITELSNELKTNGYTLTVVKSEKKGTILGEEIFDQTLEVKGDNFTEIDLRKVTSLITNPRRENPIKIKSTDVEQVYVSASGDGTANVQLHIEITENAKAYYKKTGKQVHLNRSPDKQSATFDYRRKFREEHVDIYFVPDYEDQNHKPKKFLRISLSYPYEARPISWDPIHVRFWKLVTGKK